MYDRQARIIGTAVTVVVYIVLLRLQIYFSLLPMSLLLGTIYYIITTDTAFPIQMKMLLILPYIWLLPFYLLLPPPIIITVSLPHYTNATSTSLSVQCVR